MRRDDAELRRPLSSATINNIPETHAVREPPTMHHATRPLTAGHLSPTVVISGSGGRALSICINIADAVVDVSLYCSSLTSDPGQMSPSRAIYRLSSTVLSHSPSPTLFSPLPLGSWTQTQCSESAMNWQNQAHGSVCVFNFAVTSVLLDVNVLWAAVCHAIPSVSGPLVIRLGGWCASN